MTTNAERVAEIIYSHMSSWDDEAQAVNATQDLVEAGLLKPATQNRNKMSNLTIEQLEDLKFQMEPTPPFLEALIEEKKAHAELRAWVESLHPRVGSVEGGAVTFHKAHFLDEITRVLEGDDD